MYQDIADRFARKCVIENGKDFKRRNA